MSDLASLYDGGASAGQSDEQLLDRYARRGDPSAFEALVVRHGPLVLGYCRRSLRDDHAADDAFQATFLVLARRAGAVRADDSLGRWLAGVARKVVARSRCRGAVGWPEAFDPIADEPGPDALAVGRELGGLVRAEVERLPVAYRRAVELCHLEGRSHEEAARRLRWPVGTVKGRLARARALLRGRLARRGAAPAIIGTAALAGSSRAATVPRALIESTTRAARLVAGRGALMKAVGAVPAAVVLSEGVVRTMIVTQWAGAATLGLAVAALGSGAFTLAARDDGPTPAPAGVVPSPAPGSADGPAGGDAAEIRRLNDRVQQLERELSSVREFIGRDVLASRAPASNPSPATGPFAAGSRDMRPAGEAPYDPAAFGRQVDAPPGHRSPTEGSKVTTAEYVIEPPDLLRIVLDAGPKSPRLDGEYLVRPDGRIALGFYGELFAAGLTTAELKEKLVLHLRAYLDDHSLGLVEDGRAVAPARSRRLAVDVSAYNSKFYYVQGNVAQPGRFHVTGNETVLDAITLAGGLVPGAGSQNIRLVRPARPGTGREQLLPVDLTAIVGAGDTATNYQLMAGDRLIVYVDPAGAASDPSTATPAPDDPAATPAEADPPARASQLRELERKLDRILERLDPAPAGKPPLELEPLNDLKS